MIRDATRRPSSPARSHPDSHPTARSGEGDKADGKKSKVKVDKGHNTTVGEKSTQKNLVNKGGGRTTVHGKGPGGIHGDAFVEKPSLKIDAGASAGIHGLGADVKVNLDLEGNAVKAGGSLHKDISFSINGEKYKVKLDLTGEGKIGADAHLNLNVHLGLDGAKVSIGGEGFAGAKASLKGSIELDHMEGKKEEKLIGGSAKVEAGAGVGGSASFQVGKDGFSAKAYGYAGVGVGVELKGDIHAGNIAEALAETLDPKALAKAGLKVAEEGGKKVIEGVAKGGKYVADGINSAGKFVFHNVSSGAQAVWDAGKNVLRGAGGKVIDIAKDIGHFITHPHWPF